MRRVKSVYQIVAIFVIVVIMSFPLTVMSADANPQDGLNSLNVTNISRDDNKVKFDLTFTKPDEMSDNISLWFRLGWDYEGTDHAQNVSCTSEDIDVENSDFLISDLFPNYEEYYGSEVFLLDFDGLPEKFTITVNCDVKDGMDKLYLFGISDTDYMSDIGATIGFGIDMEFGDVLTLEKPICIPLTNSSPIQIPTSSITDTTKGAATVTGTVENGTATLNVACDKACVVAYTTDDGATYTRVSAVQAESGYDFVVPNYTESMKFVVSLKGDVNGDGILDSTDTGQVKAVQLGKIKTFTSIQTLAADLNGNGTIESTEAGQIKAAQLGKIQLAW